MSIIKGTLIFTRDMNEAISIIAQSPSNKCLFVGDSMGKYDTVLNQYGIIPSSILMPDLICMEADINGDPMEFKNKYYAYLNSEGPKTMLVTIITALYQGKNIVLLVPPEANGLAYPNVLLEYFRQFHGIMAASKEFNTQPAYDPSADLSNANYMYGFNTISPTEYLAIAGPNFNMIDKLCYDTHITIQPQTDFNSIRSYFEQWRQNIIAGSNLIKPFGMA